MLLKPTTWGLALAGLAALALFASAQAGDKALDLKGQIKVGQHTTKLEAGTLYKIEAAGKGFRPKLLIPTNPRFFQEKYDQDNLYSSFTIINDTRDYRITVIPDPLDPIKEGDLDYTLKITPVVLEAKPLLKVADKWTDKDPLYQPQRDSHFKAYPLKMKAGQFYLIDLVKKSNLDPYLYLENDKKDVVASDDDSGGMLNARIIFRAEKDGEYRIIATTLGKSTGDYELTVRTEKK